MKTIIFYGRKGGRTAKQQGLSTDIRNWTLFDIENWTPGLCDVAPRLSRSGLSR